MSTDLFSVLYSLGSVCEYRTPDNLEEVWDKIQTEVRSLESKFREQKTDRDRVLYALDVLDKMLLAIRARASKCELQHSSLACENVDVFQMSVDWVDFVRKNL